MSDTPTPPAALDEVELRRLAAAPLEELSSWADSVCRAAHGDAVFVRGLVEATNRCVLDCAYCGIRRSNARVTRYALSDAEILGRIGAAFDAGLRSFVVQGAEDPDFSPLRLARLAQAIFERTQGEAALAYSFGTLKRSGYIELKAAGVDRYLMRFETSDPKLYRTLRGSELSERLRALADLRELDFEVGSGFMTGLPGAGPACLIEDVLLCKRLDLDMVGIGPFIPHPDTPLGVARGLGIEACQRAVALTRLALPLANIPATTAAGTVAPDGRERVLSGGANVLMPNIGPVAAKRDYALYPGKICLDEDGLSCVGCLSVRCAGIGKRLAKERGGAPSARSRRSAASGERPAPASNAMGERSRT